MQPRRPHSACADRIHEIAQSKRRGPVQSQCQEASLGQVKAGSVNRDVRLSNRRNCSSWTELSVLPLTIIGFFGQRCALL